MRLKVILPQVEPERYAEPQVCPQAGCGGRHVQVHQVVSKAVRDTRVQEVQARRYRCLRCQHTWRVYPVGVSGAHTSARLRGIGVMVYLLGLSYGAVALALEALGYPLGKTSVYQAVQAAGEQVAGLRREAVRLPAGQTLVAALGVDLTSVKCRGQWVTVAVSVDAVQGPTVSIDLVDNAETATLTEWVRQVAQALQAQVLVSDDADGFKSTARDLNLEHQVCISHVLRNTHERIAELRPLVEQDTDGSLATLGLDRQQVLVDLQRLEQLIHQRQPAQEPEVGDLHFHYLQAPAPSPGSKASLAYRLRMLFLDRWNLWPRLPRYRLWSAPQQQRLDGTNNACERAIGWWIKERYRTMRGYKRRQSVLNVSRLTAWVGNLLSTSGADLALVVA